MWPVLWKSPRGKERQCESWRTREQGCIVPSIDRLKPGPDRHPSSAYSIFRVTLVVFPPSAKFGGKETTLKFATTSNVKSTKGRLSLWPPCSPCNQAKEGRLWDGWRWRGELGGAKRHPSPISWDRSCHFVKAREVRRDYPLICAEDKAASWVELTRVNSDSNQTFRLMYTK